MSEEEKILNAWSNEEFYRKISEKFEKLERFEARTLNQLANLEKHILNMVFPMQNIRELFNDNKKIQELSTLLGQPIQIDDRKIQGILREFQTLLADFGKALEAVNLTQTLGEIKYLGNRMNTIEEYLTDMAAHIKHRNVRIFYDDKEMVPGDDHVYKPKKKGPQRRRKFSKKF